MFLGAAFGQHQAPLYAPGNSAELSTGNDYGLLSVTGQNAIGITENDVYKAHLGLLGPVRYVLTNTSDFDLGLNQLYQNYPNPFSNTTTIPFEIAREGKVRLTLYNMLGQLVEVVIEQKMPPGKHQVEFKAENTRPGLFFYKLKINDYQETKTMVLTK